MPVILGKSGVNRELKEIYLGNSGINRKEKELYLGKVGVNKQVYKDALLRLDSVPIDGVSRDLPSRFTPSYIEFTIIMNSVIGTNYGNISLYINDSLLANWKFGGAIIWSYHDYSSTYQYRADIPRGGSSGQYQLSNFELGKPYKFKLEFTDTALVSTFGNNAPITETWGSVGISGRPMIATYQPWLSNATGAITNFIIK